MSEGFIERLNDEYTELANRIHKLTLFMQNDDLFREVADVQKGLMIGQLQAMNAYASILGSRLLTLKSMAEAESAN